MSVTVNLTLPLGMHWVQTFAAQTPQNITGATVRFTLRDYATRAVVLTKDNAGVGGLAITDAVNGVVAVTLVKADTLGVLLAGRAYSYDVDRVDVANEDHWNDGLVFAAETGIT